MGISETKKQIVIDNYFKNTCDVNTSIKEAFTKGFEVGLTKAVFPKDQYEVRLKADMVAMLKEIKNDLAKLKSYESVDGQDLVMLADIGIYFDKKISELEDKDGNDTTNTGNN